MGLLNLIKIEQKKNDADGLSDEQLLTLSQSKPKYFEVLLGRYDKAFLRKAKSILFNEEDAEDAVQDTFVKIYKYAPGFTPLDGAKFSSWAYKILVNTCLTLYTKKKREGNVMVSLTDELVAVTSDDSVVELQEFERNIDYLHSLIQRLPKLQRRTMSLYIKDGLDQKEVAKIEGVAPNIIRTRIHRAKKLLKQLHESEL